MLVINSATHGRQYSSIISGFTSIIISCDKKQEVDGGPHGEQHQKLQTGGLHAYPETNSTTTHWSHASHSLAGNTGWLGCSRLQIARSFLSVRVLLYAVYKMLPARRSSFLYVTDRYYLRCCCEQSDWLIGSRASYVLVYS